MSSMSMSDDDGGVPNDVDNGNNNDEDNQDSEDHNYDGEDEDEDDTGGADADDEGEESTAKRLPLPKLTNTNNSTMMKTTSSKPPTPERFEVGGEGRLGTLAPPSPKTLHSKQSIRAVQSKASAYGNSQISFDTYSDDDDASPSSTAAAAAAATKTTAVPSKDDADPPAPPTLDSHASNLSSSMTTVKSGNTHHPTDDSAIPPVDIVDTAEQSQLLQPEGLSTEASSEPTPETTPGAAAVTTTGKPSKGLPKTKSNKKGHAPVIAAAEAPLDGTSTDRIRLGICALDKKARSRPMAEILSRLDETLFHVVFFGDDVILERSIEDWPVVQVLVAFYSKGYPLVKAKEYVKLRKPFVLNDLDMQEQLMDRRKVYDLLEASGIDVPRHAFLSTDGYVSTGSGDGNKQGDTVVEEFDDHIEVNGLSINKPFVEKPIDADDHNIAIYYPSSAGGGCKKLFRKIGNRSSEFYPDINEVRRDGSYIYEEFVETQGTDVKMYTVGPEYGHAEARKSPTVDGKVQRNAEGKEIRFPVILTLGEKEIARRIVLQFKQFICGFDLLRVQTDRNTVVSYVCDVNGFSFVKNSRKYYDDCAQILTEHMLAAVKPESLMGFSTLDPMVKNVDDDESSVGFFPIRPGATLQRVARLLGQGDSKSNVTTPVASSDGTNDDVRPGNLSPPRSDHSNGVRLAHEDPTTLLEGAVPVRNMPQELLSEPASLNTSRHNSADDLKLDASQQRKSASGRMHKEELRCVIAIVRHGDRTPKQKLKVNLTEPLILEYFHKHCEGDSCTKDLKIKAKTPLLEFVATVKTILAGYEQEVADGKTVNKKLCTQLRHMRDVLERWKITGLNRKLQIKPRTFDENLETGEKKCTEVQLILKWGGNLTKLGENQAIRLGQQFRQEMYPDAPGGGILRLHSTFRHDLKIKTSDEGRVMKTAAAFAKGLLELEGEIPPILVSLVHKEKGSMHMLDPSGDKDAKLELDECKEKITANLQEDIDWRAMTEEDRVRMVGPPQLTAMRDSLAEVGNPRKTLMLMYQTMGTLIDELEEMLGHLGSGDERQIEGGEGLKGDHEDDVALSGVKLYKGETLLELTERWKFIYKRLYDPETDEFDLSRVPDVHDNVRFDVLHNPHLGLTSILEKLYSLAKGMADCVVPQEYGTTLQEKRSVGIKICSPLVEKVRYDLNIARTDNKADMRYMINMDYSADLPINTMGRRIRTRLYFTSESHLHTMLNVLRFSITDASSPVCTSPVLSPGGMNLLNDSKELCYLTQIVLRLFEDTSRSNDDPRRYRVEILFSAGATATPLHMSAATRENDLTRLDTDRLRAIGRDGLTCSDVENFFDAIISESGKADDHFDGASTSTADLRKVKKSNKQFGPSNIVPQTLPEAFPVKEGLPTISIDKGSTAGDSVLTGTSDLEDEALADDLMTADKQIIIEEAGESGMLPVTSNDDKEAAIRALSAAESGETIKVANRKSVSAVARGIPSFINSIGTDDQKKDAGDGKKEESENVNSDDIFRKYFYTFVAAGSLLLGAGCLVMAIGLSGDGRNRRRFARR